MQTFFPTDDFFTFQPQKMYTFLRSTDRKGVLQSLSRHSTRLVSHTWAYVWEDRQENNGIPEYLNITMPVAGDSDLLTRAENESSDGDEAECRICNFYNMN